jgi:quercetin dioxygenase-like cupin family protein
MAFCLPFALMLLLAIGLQPLASYAQDEENPTRPRRVRPGEEGLILFGLVTELPQAPVFINLIRQNLAPGANSPLHYHPGPEVGLVEGGVSSVQIEEPSDLLPAGRTKPIPAPVGEEFEMERGDQILYLPGAPHTFTNNQDDEDTTILVATVFPCGESCDAPTVQQSVAVTAPGPNAYAGLSFVQLGWGTAATLPTGQGAIAIERLILEPGESIPASDVPTMLAMESGQLDFTAVEGEFYRSDAAEQFVYTAVEAGDEVALTPETAVTFPNGNAEVERPDTSGQISLLRLTIRSIPSDGGATPEASPVASPVAEGGNLAVIEITEQEEPTPAPTEDAAAEPTEAADAPPGELAVGAVVAITEPDVRLRDAPTVNSSIILGLDQGAEFTITEGPIEADGFVWWGVQSTADPSIVGYVAGDFLAPV